MKKSLKAAWERFLPAEETYIPRLTPGAVTKLSWPRRVEAIDQAPELYRESLQELCSQAGGLPDTIFLPTYGWFFWRDPGKLLCSLGDRLYILENERGRVAATCYPLEAIHALDVGMILLYSWLTIHCQPAAGQPAAKTLVFNSVCSELFTPLLQQIRCAAAGGLPSADLPAAPDRTELGKFDYLVVPHFKFMNYARRSLLPGAVVLDSLLQPALHRPVVRVFGRSLSRAISADHLLILTDRELILLRETAPGSQAGDTRYGGVWSYFPLRRLRSLALDSRPDGLLRLAVHLPGGEQVEILFAADKAAAVQALVRQAQPR